jgi:aspartate aminotransferase
MSWHRPIYRPLTPPVFRQVIAKSEEAAARGVEVLEISAVPWQLPGANVLRAAQEAATRTRRAPAQGLPELRRAIAERIAKVNGQTVSPDSEILITNGSMHGLWLVMLGLLNEGDEVLMTSPGFIVDSLVRLAGAHPVFASLRESEGWRINIDSLEAQVTERTRILYFCNPDNPTGTVATQEEVLSVLEFCERHDLFCVLDEVFDTQVFDGLTHVSALSFADWKHRVVVVQSFTKSYAMPGWRLGNLVGPSGVVSHLTQLLQWTMLDLPYVTQVAGTEAVTGPQDWVQQLGPDFQRNRDRILRELQTVSGVSYVVPQGGAFFFINVSGLGVTSQTLARDLRDLYGIPVYPGYNYNIRGEYVRLAFGANEANLEALARRLPVALADAARRSAPSAQRMARPSPVR